MVDSFCKIKDVGIQYYHTFARLEELLRGNEEEKKNLKSHSNNAGQQPNVAELSSPKSERRSRRSNRGHHWKFSEEKANSSSSISPALAVPELPREAEEGSCSFSLALQAFDDEEYEEEAPVDESRTDDKQSGGTKRRLDGSNTRTGKRSRKRRQPRKDSDEVSDPDDPGEVEAEESGRGVLPVASAVRTLDILQEPFRLLTFYRLQNVSYQKSYYRVSRLQNVQVTKRPFYKTRRTQKVQFFHKICQKLHTLCGPCVETREERCCG